MRRAGLLLLILIATSAPARPAAADVHDLIRDVLGAYGGHAALAKVKAYRMEGSLFSTRRHDAFPTTRVFDRPNRLKVLIEYEGGSEARVLDGPRAWRNESGGPLEPATGPMRDAMVLQGARANVPWILAELEQAARAIEPLERDSVELLGIEIPLDNGLVFRAYVHPETHRVAVSQGVLPHGGSSTSFETVYSDYREVEGILFAFREENWASGMKTGVTTLERVLLNPKLRRDEFRPPPPVERREKTKAS